MRSCYTAAQIAYQNQIHYPHSYSAIGYMPSGQTVAPAPHFQGSCSPRSKLPEWRMLRDLKNLSIEVAEKVLRDDDSA